MSDRRLLVYTAEGAFLAEAEWPDDAPEAVALRLGQAQGWRTGLYTLVLFVDGEIRAWREIALGFPEPPPPPPDPFAPALQALDVAAELIRFRRSACR
jgi:hypothetical protein